MLQLCDQRYVLTPAQRKYCTTRKELLALVTLTRHFRHYLLWRSFLARTNHASLTWLMRFRHVEGQLARWLEELSQYDVQVVHRKGSLHSNVDGLSRIPAPEDTCLCYQAGRDLESLPCGGCTYCKRVHLQWERFHEEMDDVVPIASDRSPNLSTLGLRILGTLACQSCRVSLLRICGHAN